MKDTKAKRAVILSPRFKGWEGDIISETDAFAVILLDLYPCQLSFSVDEYERVETSK